MTDNQGLNCNQFPRSNGYSLDWVLSNVSGGANSLWLTEWLCEAMSLRPGMRVLDLGCGRAASSIFLHREYGVQVWAADLWFDPTENLQRVTDAGASNGVFPLRANARQLPFADQFFDTIASIDAFMYFGTDDYYLNHLLRFLKPGGQLGIAVASVLTEIQGEIPPHLAQWWNIDKPWSLHSPTWWKAHWLKSDGLDIEVADSMPDGWKRWLDWQRVASPNNDVERHAIETDQGRNVGYARVVGRRRATELFDLGSHVIPASYAKANLD